MLPFRSSQAVGMIQHRHKIEKKWLCPKSNYKDQRIKELLEEGGTELDFEGKVEVVQVKKQTAESP